MHRYVVIGAIGALALWVLMSKFQESFDAGNGSVMVMNLDRHSDRLASFMRDYEASDAPAALGPATRLPAIDGTRIDPESVVHPRALEALREVVRTGKRMRHDELTPGAIGCYLSHQKAWHQLAASGKEWALVFEDDARLPRDLWARASPAVREAPADWDVILLGYEGDAAPIPGSSRLVRVRRFLRLHAYLISRKAAKTLAENMLPMSQQVDWALSELIAKGGLVVYAVTPQIVDINYFGTSIQTPFK
jgi:GR25 family glycosyltransferase involved in LPS biosynthesis